MTLKELVSKFAEQAKVDAKLAKRIIDRLDAKGMTPEEMNSVLWRMKDWFLTNEYAKFLKGVKDDVIDSVIEEMIERKARMEAESKVRMYAEDEIIMRGFEEMEFEEHPEFKPGDKVEIQIMRTGVRQHPLYGEIKVDGKTMKEVVEHFTSDSRGIKLAVDENHEPNHKALGRYEKLYMKGKDALFATIELTRKGAKLLTDGAYQYFSPEIAFIKKDEESGESLKNLLVGGAFTNRPFFKKMQPLLVAASEAAILSPVQFDESGSLFIFGKTTNMKKLIELITKFAEAGKISKADQLLLKAEYEKFTESDIPEELQSAVKEALAFSDEAPAEGSADKGDEGKEGEDNKGGDEKAGEEGKDPEAGDSEGDAPETVKANEDGTVTLKLHEYEALKGVATAAQKVVAEARKTMVRTTVEGLLFNENTQSGFITPKSKDKVVAFAMSLSETKCSEFFEILQGVKVLPFGEAGHSEETGAAEDQEAMKFFTEKLRMSPEAAKSAVSAFKAKQN